MSTTSADISSFPATTAPGLSPTYSYSSRLNPDKTVLIINSNPTSAPPPIPRATTGAEFHPDAVHRSTSTLNRRRDPSFSSPFHLSRERCANRMA